MASVLAVAAPGRSRSTAARCDGDTDDIESDTVQNWFKIKITLMTSKMGWRGGERNFLIRT